MGMYYGTVQSAVVHTNETPLSKNPHASNPAFPTGGGLGGFIFFAVWRCWTSWPPRYRGVCDRAPRVEDAPAGANPPEADLWATKPSSPKWPKMRV